MPSKKPIMKVYVTPEEYRQVIDQADRHGLSISAFARRVCLGQPLPARDHQQARRELARINADLGRLGGLFKLWLCDERRAAPELTYQVRRLLREIEARQRELCAAVGRIA
ncbi:plasmid mobilization protein [Megalodesulfovibrio gigas]|uniref:Putative plasmid conjugal transfer protein n=1 Tax=Megalodesulfovibrio gigas (strain ATCC 19364 / DSM 1382 / NCIMB 9332 / VKM B-1759) TaxID=1121448 RepID=T2G8Y8_MEGG1|nr:conjugal transfer protein [Megalodesulfovibrio gigas]AGW12382.1 putative plasmid conjugal transfer protein [Megalodesulfovibrio gigas DSM 1382 = ATCC 19364]